MAQGRPLLNVGTVACDGQLSPGARPHADLCGRDEMVSQLSWAQTAPPQHTAEQGWWGHCCAALQVPPVQTDVGHLPAVQAMQSTTAVVLG